MMTRPLSSRPCSRVPKALRDAARSALINALAPALRGTARASVVLALAGCAAWRPTTVPMRVLHAPAACAERADTLVVMLPGRGDGPEDFLREGFVAALRAQRVRADVALPDAHLGYYRERKVIDRLRADVLAPARAQGYAHVWLVGISLGAFGALITSAQGAQGIDGIVAIGPYLGEREIAEEIAAQGGLRRWQAPPPDASQAPVNVDPTLWRWLQGYADPDRASQRPALYLGYGRDDRFAFNDALLAAVLPPARVFTTEGGHDWPPWIALWRRTLEQLPLARDASCAAGRAE